MASRKASPVSAAKAATLSAARAAPLLRTQVDVARPLLANPQVDRLVFEGWEQTTHAVLVATFGDPSDNVSRFEEASPAYPGRAGEDERFWGKYRRDELEAKLVSLESSIAQLNLRLVTAEIAGVESASTSPHRHPYEAAREVLKVLHHYFLHHGHRNWSISPVKDGQNNFSSVGLDEDGARKALLILAAKGLAEQKRHDAFKITEYGVSACDHPETLEHELPIDSDAGRGRGPETKTFELAVLANVGDLLANDELRDIVTRDVAELGRAVEAGLAKSIMLLGGSILEGILIDVLDRNRALAATYMKKRRFPDDASLQDLVAIAGDAALLDPPRHLLTPTSVALAKAVTDHRDLIHPHAEARGRILVDDTTAQALCHLVIIVVRDLLDAKERGDVAAYESR